MLVAGGAGERALACQVLLVLAVVIGLVVKVCDLFGPVVCRTQIAVHGAFALDFLSTLRFLIGGDACRRPA